MGGPRLLVFTSLGGFVWPYRPRTFFYRDNRSSRVGSLFSAVLGRHSCTKSIGLS